MKNYVIVIDKPNMIPGSGKHTATSWEIRSTPDMESKTNLIHHSYRNATNLYEYRINLDLTNDDVIYVRSKFHFGDKESKWSNPVPVKGEQKGFKLSNIVVCTPIVSYEFDVKSDRVNQLVLRASEMNIFIGYGNHLSTSWIITDSDGKVVYERLEDKDNLNELSIGLDILDLSKTYVVKVKYHTDTNGTSRYGRCIISEGHVQGSLFDMRLLTPPIVGRTCTAEVILKTINFKASSLRMVSSTGAILAEVLDQPTLYPSFPIARNDDGTIDISGGIKPLFVEAGQDLTLTDLSKYDYIIVAEGARIRYKDPQGVMQTINGYAFIATRSSSRKPIDLETPGFEGIYVLNNVSLTMNDEAKPIDTSFGSNVLDRRPNGEVLYIEAGETRTIDNPTAYDTIIVYEGGRVQWQDSTGKVVKIDGYSYICGRNLTKKPEYIEDAGYRHVYVIKDSTLTISSVEKTDDYVTSTGTGSVGENVKIYGRIKLKDGTTTEWKLLYFGNIQDVSIVNTNANTEYLGKYSYSGEMNLNGYSVQMSRELHNNEILFAKYNDRRMFKGVYYNNRIIESGVAFHFPEALKFTIPYVNVIPTYSDAFLVNFAIFNEDNYKSSVWARYQIDRNNNVYTYDTHVIASNELYSTALNGSAVACKNGYVYYIPTRMRDGSTLSLYKLNIEDMSILKEDNLPFKAKRDVSMCMLDGGTEFLIFGGNNGTKITVGNEDIYPRENNVIYKYSIIDRTFTRVGVLDIIDRNIYSIQAVLRKDGKVVFFNSANQGDMITNQSSYLYDPVTNALTLEDNDYKDEHVYRNTFALSTGDILRVASKEYNTMPIYNYLASSLTVNAIEVPLRIEDPIENLHVTPEKSIVIEDPTRYGTIVVDAGASVTFTYKDNTSQTIYGKCLIITSNIDTPLNELNIESYPVVYVIDNKTLTILEDKRGNENEENTRE